MNIQKSITDKAPMLGSSVDPDKIGATVKGILIASAAVIIAVAGYFGVTIELNDVTTIANSLNNLIVALGGVYGIGLGIFGAVRKVINRNK